MSDERKGENSIWIVEMDEDSDVGSSYKMTMEEVKELIAENEKLKEKLTFHQSQTGKQIIEGMEKYTKMEEEVKKMEDQASLHCEEIREIRDKNMDQYDEIQSLNKALKENVEMLIKAGLEREKLKKELHEFAVSSNIALAEKDEEIKKLEEEIKKLAGRNSEMSEQLSCMDIYECCDCARNGTDKFFSESAQEGEFSSHFCEMICEECLGEGEGDELPMETYERVRKEKEGKEETKFNEGNVGWEKY